jgi:hypothetical protein
MSGAGRLGSQRQARGVSERDRREHVFTTTCRVIRVIRGTSGRPGGARSRHFEGHLTRREAALEGSGRGLSRGVEGLPSELPPGASILGINSQKANRTIRPHPIGHSKVEPGGRKMAGEDEEVMQSHCNFQKVCQFYFLRHLSRSPSASSRSFTESCTVSLHPPKLQWVI